MFMGDNFGIDAILSQVFQHREASDLGKEVLLHMAVATCLSPLLQVQDPNEPVEVVAAPAHLIPCELVPYLCPSEQKQPM